MADKAKRLARRVENRAQKDDLIRRQRELFKRRQRSKRIINYVIGALVLVAVIYGVIVWYTGRDTGRHDDLARCLVERGVVMYGTEWCQHCQDQKLLFGRSFRLVPYVNCDVSPLCTEKGITSYPTWIFADGSRSTGTLPLEALSVRAGCGVQ